MKKIGWIPMSFLWAAACGEPSALVDSRHPTGSQAMALTAERDGVIVAHADEGVLGRVGLDGSLTELRLDGEPTRVTQAQGRYFVTLRQARSLAVVQVAADRTLHEVQRIEIGAEPFGVVTPEDQAHVYVAVALEGVVKEVDSRTLQVTRTFDVEGEPRWLAWHPDGVIYAMSAWNGMINTIHLDSGEVEQFGLPEMRDWDFVESRMADFDRRVTGDPTVTPDGKQLLVPVMYFDTFTPLPEPPPLDGSRSTSTPASYYGSERFRPVVVDIPVEKGGSLRIDEASPVSLTFARTTGYPASVTVTHDGMKMLVSIEGAKRVVAIPTRASTSPLDSPDDGIRGLQQVSHRRMAIAETDAGPRAVVTLAGRQALIFNFLDSSIQTIRTETLLDNQTWVTLPTRLAESTTFRLADELQVGRRLFYSADDSRMSADGSGVSCATCHFDGRTDGLSWTFARGKRQTPSLAGLVSLTEPVRWEGDRASVKEDARFTVRVMGGTAIQEAELDALAAFVDFTPRVDSPLRESASEAVARGKSLFERADVGCSGCHFGTAYTDNQTYQMFELPQVQTRSLLGIAGSPPYLHDGSAATLRVVLERSRDGSMGDTSMLSNGEMDDLESYLKSL